MAFTGWVGKADGSGLAVDEQGKITEHAQKPPENQFVAKPAGAPEGDFIQSPTGEFAPSLSAPGGQSRTEFIGEVADRRAEVEAEQVGIGAA